MPVAIIGMIVGSIALASIIIISIVGFNKANSIQGDYNTKVKDVVDQVNSAQYYEYEFDKKHKAQTVDLSKNVDDVRNTYLTKDDATSTYVKKSDAASTMNSQTLNVADNLKADKDFSQTNNIRFSSKWTGFPDNATDKSEISNDIDTYKKLMIVGNKSAGGERRVGVWDRLDVHGNLGVDNTTKTNQLVVDNTAKTNRLQLGDKFSLSGVGEAHGNDDWLRFFNKDGTDYYGGIAAGRLWSRDVSYLNGTTIINGTANINGPANMNGTMKFQNNGTGLEWGNNYSKIYDNGNLHIDTDDVMTLKAPVSLSVDSATTNINGNLNVNGAATISKGNGDWNWLRVQGNHSDNLYLGSDGGNRGIWADGPRDFAIYNQGIPGVTVRPNGEVGLGNKLSIMHDSATIYNKGRQHIHGEELLYLLNKSGVIIGKEWGGNGNLSVQGNLGVGGNIPGDWRGVNSLRKDGRWSHLDWKDNGQNYLRGYTNIDDGAGVNGNLGVNGTIYANGDIVASGGNNWIIHTPDDGRRTMYIAPSTTAGQHDWNWGRHTSINEKGGININGTLGVGASIPGDWSSANFLRRDGRWSHLDWKDNGQNYLRGYTHIDDGARVNGNLYVTGTVDAAAVTNRSDQRLKENIKTINHQELDKLSQLDPKSYQFIGDKDKTKRYGFVAQDVEKMYPNLVSTGQDGMKTLNYTDMIPLTVAGIQKLNKQVQPDKICINNTCLTEEGIKMLNKQLSR